jgi:hypothetical protein
LLSHPRQQTEAGWATYQAPTQATQSYQRKQHRAIFTACNQPQPQSLQRLLQCHNQSPTSIASQVLSRFQRIQHTAIAVSLLICDLPTPHSTTPLNISNSFSIVSTCPGYSQPLLDRGLHQQPATDAHRTSTCLLFVSASTLHSLDVVDVTPRVMSVHCLAAYPFVIRQGSTKYYSWVISSVSSCGLSGWELEKLAGLGVWW